MTPLHLIVPGGFEEWADPSLRYGSLVNTDNELRKTTYESASGINRQDLIELLQVYTCTIHLRLALGNQNIQYRIKSKIYELFKIISNAVPISGVSPNGHETSTFAVLQDKINPTSPCCLSCFAGFNG